jgi:N-methylhydantoinase A/oxoprolinase/acetone carboxylase beta subunit
LGAAYNHISHPDYRPNVGFEGWNISDRELNTTMLINIDNGGTLTDICVFNGDQVYRTKTITTPYDLSKCFFEGLRKVSEVVYGAEDLTRLLQSTDWIRYSTTQGTNALVEKKGCRLGLIVSEGTDVRGLSQTPEAEEMYSYLVGDRVGRVDVSLDDAALSAQLVELVSQLTAEGASRLVICLSGDDYPRLERHLSHLCNEIFPGHLLGSVPIQLSHEVVDDVSFNRRCWTALYNAFLHPAMERFLYNAENRLRDFKVRNPLLIYRNDGGAARVAKTIAVKTYSSGPRAGMDGVCALADHYGLNRTLSFDVGGTTTDLGYCENGQLRGARRGEIEGVEVSFALSDIVSLGVGGGSILRAGDKEITVGPDSVGGAPGPACFSMGGTDATITDVSLALGLLDPATYFGGDLRLDQDRARNAVNTNIAEPLTLDHNQALIDLRKAWVNKIARGLEDYAEIDAELVLMAFGGGGPLFACDIADAVGVRKVIVPGLAPVFSAYGIAFSDLSQEYEARLTTIAQDALSEVVDSLMPRARRDMYAEGVELDDCDLFSELLLVDSDGTESVVAMSDLNTLPEEAMTAQSASLFLRVTKAIDHAKLTQDGKLPFTEAQSLSTRSVLTEQGQQDLPVYRYEDLQKGQSAQGPCVLEEAFFTALIAPGWTFRFDELSNIILEKNDTEAL